MKTVVFDVPADSGGALTILKLYYAKAIEDKQNQLVFVISTPMLEETDNVKVIRLPWIKKSWFHRLYFDNFIAGNIVKSEKADKILSLQNIMIKGTGVRQTLYVHQSLPFIEKKFSLFENPKFWIYQNIIGRQIIHSIKRVDKVIVQTEWIKEACISKTNVSPSKIVVIPPEVSINVDAKYHENSDHTFFYPASGELYKNHEIIVKASKILIRNGITDFNVVFTLKGNESKHIEQLYEYSVENKLPINYIGSISVQDVYEYYSKTILVFPSYIETFGLPLLEAKVHETPVIASDCPFSHEILDDYDFVEFFDPFDEIALSKLMLRHINDLS